MTDNKKSDLKQIIAGSGITGIGQFVQMFLRYVYTILGTRFFGANIFGIYILSRTVTEVLSLVSNLGLGPGVMRQLSFYSGKGDSKTVNGIIRYSFHVSVASNVFFAGALFFTSNYLSINIFHHVELSLPLKIMALSVPLNSLLNIYYNIFRGLKKIKTRVITESFLLPLSLVLFLIIFKITLFAKIALILSYVFANTVVTIYAYFKFRIIVKESIKEIAFGNKDKKELWNFSLPLLISSALDFFQRYADTLMLGILSTTVFVGVYNVAFRISNFTAMPLFAFNMIFSPIVAEAFAQNDIKRISFNYKLVTKLILTFSLPIFGVTILFSRELLSVFGNEFKDAQFALIILCAGQLINVSVGATGQLLTMSGHQILNLYNSLFFVLLTFCLNLLLIPTYGVIGAGIANAITLGSLNIIRLIQIHLKLNIHPFNKDFLKPIISFIIAIVIAFAVKYFLSYNYFIINFISFALFALIYGGMNYILKFNYYEKEVIRILYAKLKIKSITI